MVKEEVKNESLTSYKQFLMQGTEHNSIEQKSNTELAGQKQMRKPLSNKGS